MQQTRSQQLFEQAQRVIPGGVNSPVRSFRAVEGTPPFIARGNGSRVWDVDGNEYIDYLGSWGPLALGHAHPAVVEAVQRAAADGTSFGAPVEQEVRLAEMICDALPSVDSVRLVNSGYRSVHDRPAPGPRIHRPFQDRQIRRQLPRPCRRAIGCRRLRRPDARRAHQRRRPRILRRRDPDRHVQRYIISGESL